MTRIRQVEGRRLLPRSHFDTVGHLYCLYILRRRKSGNFYVLKSGPVQVFCCEMIEVEPGDSGPNYIYQNFFELPTGSHISFNTSFILFTLLLHQNKTFDSIHCPYLRYIDSDIRTLHTFRMSPLDLTRGMADRCRSMDQDFEAQIFPGGMQVWRLYVDQISNFLFQNHPT